MFSHVNPGLLGVLGSPLLARNYSVATLKDLKPIKIYSSLNKPNQIKELFNDIANKGGIVLFLCKNSSSKNNIHVSYAIEGANKLLPLLKNYFEKDYLKYMANIYDKEALKPKSRIKTHYKGLLKKGWKDYDLYLLESWDINESLDLKPKLVYYHDKYPPKLNLSHYIYLANGEIETVFQWNYFKNQAQILSETQQKAELKPIITYHIDENSPLIKLRGKVWFDNKNKSGIYRLFNRITKKSYVGSSLNLGNTINYYFNLNPGRRVIMGKNIILIKALQKYGLTNFNLEIFAYCSPEELSDKELYFIQLLNPQYNINRPAREAVNSISKYKSIDNFSYSVPELKETVMEGDELELPADNIDALDVMDISEEFNCQDNLGISNYSEDINIEEFPLEDSQEVITTTMKSPIIISESPIITNEKDARNSGSSLEINNIETPQEVEVKSEIKTKRSWKLSSETIAKMKIAQSNRTKQPKEGVKVMVNDTLKNETTFYPTISWAARALNMSVGLIHRRITLNITKPYKKRYIISKC